MPICQAKTIREIEAGDVVLRRDGSLFATFTKAIRWGEVVRANAMVMADGSEPRAGDLMAPEVMDAFGMGSGSTGAYLAP